MEQIQSYIIQRVKELQRLTISAGQVYQDEVFQQFETNPFLKDKKPILKKKYKEDYANFILIVSINNFLKCM